MNPAILADGLSKRFRPVRSYGDLLRPPGRRTSVTAVDRVSFEVAVGQVFGLLGQNGAGKTTLVRMLSTLLVPTDGVAVVAGHDVTRRPRAVRARIGLISGDERSFHWRLSGRHNLEFCAALRHLPADVARRRIDALAARLDIAGHLDRPFGQLSSGQRQKLAIVRGLMSEPDILFMDEPTRSLDPISAVAIRAFIADHIVGELGRTVVLATHSMPEAEALCDRLAFIQDGRIAADGSVAELRAAIGYGIRCEIRLCGPADDARDMAGVIRTALAPLRPAGLWIEAARGPEPALLRLTVRGGDMVGAVLSHLLAAGLEILGCETREPSLEEIYVHTLTSPAPPRVTGRTAPAVAL